MKKMNLYKSKKNIFIVIYNFKKVKRKLYFINKRLFDIVFALFGTIFLVPMYLLIKIAYWLMGDTEPVIYKQKRIGKNGRIFYIYKFRTMSAKADEKLMELLEDPKYKEEWELKQKLENDPRVTKVGKILRETSLDEMPQFINVIKGEMSIIGPRPLLEGELDMHNGNRKIYESIRPGISGWWTVNGRTETTYEQRLELEYFYCKKCNLILDIKCIILTIFVVLLRKGAI